MTANKKFEKHVYEEWKSLYLNGSTLREISKKYNVSEPTVIYHLDKLNIQRRSNARSHLKNVEISELIPDYEQKQVIIGSLLGDGTITKQSLYSFLQISHAESQREWLEYKSNKLGNLVTVKGIYTRKPSGENRQNIVELRTYQNKYIDKLHSMSYANNKKYISNVFELVDPLALAVLWGDDGSYGKVDNKYEYGILSLCNFTFEENKIFSDYLYKKFTISSSVLNKKVRDKIYPQIRINKNGMEQLRNIIKNYLPNSMKYKIGGIR